MKTIEINPIEVVILTNAMLPPEAVIFDPATRTHEHCCVVCNEPLGPCQCDLSNRVEFCSGCYQMMEEDLSAVHNERSSQ